MKGKLIFAALIFCLSMAGIAYLVLYRPMPVPVSNFRISWPENAETEAPDYSANVIPDPIPMTEPEEVTEPTMPPAERFQAPEDIMEMLNGMTLEEKVGQIFLARCPEVDGAGEAVRYHLGGYLLFDRDFEEQNQETLRQTIMEYQSAAKIPLLIAVDEEGGTVCRITNHKTFRLEPFASPRELYDRGGMRLILSTESEKGWLLNSLGINVNMGPVCDMTDDPAAFMYPRSLGQPAGITAEFVSGVISTMSQWNVGTVMKHFPGYGNNTDTHTGIAVDYRTLSELEQRDLLPFRSGIQAGGGAILVAHTVLDAIDRNYPASLSPQLHRYLRTTMGFDGVIVTDDLYMEAISQQFGVGESAVLAVLAGNDLLCSTQYDVQYRAVLEAVQNGRIPVDTLDSAVAHVLCWKQSLKLI